MSKQFRVSDDAHRAAKVAAAQEGIALELWASKALIEAAAEREQAAKQGRNGVQSSEKRRSA